MQKLYYWLIVFCFVGQIGYSQSATSPSGSGTLGDPYQISSLSNLYWITEDDSRMSKHYIQTADIDASETSTWFSGEGFLPLGTPISYAEGFTGSYNGSGYKISNLHINRSESNIGFFKYLGQNALIKNINLENCNITGSTSTGGIVGSITDESSNSATVDNCQVSGQINGSSYTGGIAGSGEYPNITNCTSTATVTSTASSIGGIIGRCKTFTITNCSNKGDVSGLDKVGGIIGEDHYTATCTISGCSNYGTISGRNDIGGIAGNCTGSLTISECFTHGKIVCTGEQAGGIAGESLSIIEKCFSSAEINTPGYSGGLVGSSNATINDCYFSGILISTGHNIGGLLGKQESSGSMHNSYCSGFITSKQDYSGILDYNGNSTASDLSNTYYDIDITDKVGAADTEDILGSAEGLTTAQLLQESYYDNWTFDASHWQIEESKSRPYLHWQKVAISNQSGVTSTSTMFSVNGGYVKATGSTAVIEYGYIYQLNELPTIENGYKFEVTTGISLANGEGASINPGIVTFGPVLGDLYYARAYAIDENGDAYYGDAVRIFMHPYAGLGTEDSPFDISSLTKLNFLSENDVIWDKHFALSKDIDASSTSSLNEGKGFSPIGISNTNQFRGTFNGQGHTISNLFMDWGSTTDTQGLFGSTADGSVISNLALDNASINGDQYIGGIAGQNYGEIVKCSTNGSFTGKDDVGAIAGVNFNVVSKCYASGSVTASNGAAGGICSENSFNTDSLSFCYYNGSVSASSFYGGGAITGVKNGDGIGYYNYYNNEACTLGGWYGTDTPGVAEGLTAEEMKDKVNYINWDFNDVWGIDPSVNSGFPVLTGFGHYVVSAYATGNGSIDIEYSLIAEGGDITLNFTADPDHEVDSVYLDGVFQNDDINLSLTDIQSNHRIKVVFVESIPTDVKSPKTSLPKVYPNPASNYIIIENNNISERIEIINTQGQVVKLVSQSKLINKIDLSGIPQGLYYIKYNEKDKPIAIVKK